MIIFKISEMYCNVCENDLVKKKLLSAAQATEELNITVEEFEEKSGLKAD